MDNTARNSRRLLVALAALVAVLLPGAPAWAHNSLVEAQPAKGVTLQRPPAEVKLRFLQRLDPARTAIAVTDAAGRAVPAAAPVADGKTGTLTFRDALPGGGYTVAYEVSSTDGHTVKGSYRFTVAGATPASVPAGEPAASSAAGAAAPAVARTAVAATGDDGGMSTGVLAGLVVLGAVLAGTAVLVLLRRRRPAR